MIRITFPAQESPSPISKGDIGSVRNRSFAYNLYDFKFKPQRNLNFALCSSPNPNDINQDFAQPSSDPRKLNRPKEKIDKYINI